jgi:hypothetical protein
VVKTLGYARVAGEETDDAWAARIAHQLEAAALYDPDSGWTDVVAAATGRPVSEPPLLHRAGDWLAGAPDPVFDQQIPAWVARAWSVPGVADLPDQAGLWLAQALHGHNTHVHAANLAADMEWALGEVAGKPRGEAVRGLANIASATVTLAAQLVAEGEDDERKWYSLDQQIDGYEDAGALEDLAALAGGARDRLRHVAAQHESAYTGPRD